MPYVPWKVVGDQDDVDGAAPIGVIDLPTRSLQVQQKDIVESLAVAKTMAASDTGKTIIITAALTVTLPANSAALKGVKFKFIIGADVAVTFAATATELVVFNNVAATSIAFSTSGEKAGTAVEFVSNGTKWYAQVMLAAESVTPTIA